MIELVQLERRHEDFARRHTRVVVISMESPEIARKTQEQFPHLIALADEGRGLSEAAGVVHPHGSPDGQDIDTPTTILVDRRGVVRWLYRSARFIARLAPDALLDAIDRYLP